MVACILVVDDDAVAREGLAALLREEGHEVRTASSGEAALAQVAQHAPDLIISDVRMPHGDGFYLVEHLRSSPTSARIPILLVSALADPGRRVAGLDLGADDFLSKPVDVAELLARVRSQLRRVKERDDLERRAASDPLTGVLNRRGISAVLRREEQRARRSGSHLSVLMADIDRFKQLNDRHGHLAGDTVLRHVARALEAAVRAGDQVGRFGGDEFLVILPDSDAAAAAALAARLHKLALPPLARDGGPDLRVTVSIGVATLRRDDTVDALIARADREMYRVKRTAELPPIPHP